MIDGSEKRNRQLVFELHNLHVCEKRSINYHRLRSTDYHVKVHMQENKEKSFSECTSLTLIH